MGMCLITCVIFSEDFNNRKFYIKKSFSVFLRVSELAPLLKANSMTQYEFYLRKTEDPYLSNHSYF